MTSPIATDRKPSAPKPRDPVELFGRGLERLREVGLSVQNQPLKEVRVQMGVDIQVVYATIRVPIGDGVTLRLPLLTTIRPKFYSPTQAQHL